MSDPRHVEGVVRAVRRAGTVEIPEHVDDPGVAEQLSEEADVVTLATTRETAAADLTGWERVTSLVSYGFDADEGAVGVKVSTPWGDMVEHVERDVLLRRDGLDHAEGDHLAVEAFPLDDAGGLWLPTTSSVVTRIPRESEPVHSTAIREHEPLTGRMDLTPYQGVLARLNRRAGDLVRAVRGGPV